jgi:hypothetical protein
MEMAFKRFRCEGETKLTSRSRVIPETLIIVHLVEQLFSLHEIGVFTTGTQYMSVSSSPEANKYTPSCLI